MKTYLLIYIISFAFLNLNAQTISPTLISTGGAISFSNEIKVDWSIGEIAVNNYDVDANLSEGFHQGTDIITSVFTVNPNRSLMFYPNPNHGNLKLKGNSDELISIEIFDMLGEIVSTFNEVRNLYYIGALHSGTYFIRTSFSNSTFEIHKIIKI